MTGMVAAVSICCVAAVGAVACFASPSIITVVFGLAIAVEATAYLVARRLR